MAYTKQLELSFRAYNQTKTTSRESSISHSVTHETEIELFCERFFNLLLH